MHIMSYRWLWVNNVVAKVRAFEISGLKIWWWSREGDIPHFHVKKSGEWEIKVRFLSCTRKNLDFEAIWNSKSRLFTKSERQILLESITENMDQLLREWEESRPSEDN